ncbi:formyl transferase [Sphingomonas crusticola]|uniref:glucosamine inositolphosphorylceramide transferase family protein n=1 Tax=Sphingomonas crusticola TaxID=1697973 RepID=UPI001F072968|nr:formyl transferase [Sphingomonas crusticola]
MRAPIEAIAARGGVDPAAITWLAEEGPFRFLADPFGLWRDDRLYLFAEAYDYRTRHGVIEVITLDANMQAIGRETALKAPWHLSYPYVFEAEGATWMLPEAHKSGGLTLYRAADFPHRWEAAARIALDVVPIDATPVFHDGRWWLFYSGGPDRASRMGALHCAWADRLERPWHPHPRNPIRCDIAGARPGGTPFVTENMLALPVQDCSHTYGGAIRILRFPRLTPERVETIAGPPLPPPAGTDYRDGFHTLSGCGPVTLIDVKRVDRSGRGWLIDLQRAFAASVLPGRDPKP